jgi:SanA protein
MGEGSDRRKRGWARLVAKLVGLVLVVVVAVPVGVNGWLGWRAGGDSYAVPGELEGLRARAAMSGGDVVGVVFGTAEKVAGGRDNLFFRSRMEAAAELYRSGVVSYLLVSGDNRRHDYNEPEAMKARLVELGVPGEVVVCDYAGLRSLDTVVRAREIFGVERAVLVSDDYHLPRVLFLARAMGLDAVGAHGASFRWKTSGKVRMREMQARVLAVWDVVRGRGPRHLGELEEVPWGGEG